MLPVSTKPLQPQQNKTRRKPLLPVSTKPLQPQQNKTAVQDPTDQKDFKLEKKIEQKKHTLKMMKNDSHTASKSKNTKDGQKESTQHKCLFSYTEQDWPAGAEKVKAKKSAKKGQVLFEDKYIILRGGCPS